jgi:hypothetical protein
MQSLLAGQGSESGDGPLTIVLYPQGTDANQRNRTGPQTLPVT